MTAAYQKFSGVSSLLAGIFGLLYLILFLLLKNPAALLPALALLLVSLFASVVWVALYLLVRPLDAGFALWGFVLGMGGVIGAAIHAAFDLNNTLHPPATPFAYANPVDPRGFLTFAITGLGLLVISSLIVRGNTLSQALGYFGLVAGVALFFLYLAYLLILNAANPVVLLLILITGILQPIWYLWLGWMILNRGTPSPLGT